MSTEILVSSDPWENRVAILEDGRLAEIYFEREEKVIGSIFKGKVQNVLPGMGASFVDIGLGRNAFLYVDDINKTPLNIGDVEITQGRTGWTINEKVNKGDDVLVQIVKEPRGLKGARISTNISLPGRYLILMPTGKYSGVSRKIESADERNRLKTIMKSIRPLEMATVVRTAAAGVSQAELLADLGVLIRMWHGILETYKRAPSPSLIHKDMNLVYKAARDFITPEVDRVLIDDAEEFEKVRDFMRLLGPQYVNRIEHYNSGRSLFKDFKVDEEVERLLRPKINLPSGGSLVIETTEALTVIDINSGKFTGGRNLEDTIVKTNIEAAAEIARQVRLRDIGGIIVCDFIDMNSEASRSKVLATLEAGLKKDRTRTTIQSFSALGLLEFTRKRVGKDLSGQLRGACPTCNGIGSVMSPESVAIDAFREVRRLGHDHAAGEHAGENGKKKTADAAIEVLSAPTVGAQLEYWYEDEMAVLERELGTRIAVRVDPALHPEKTKIFTVAAEALLEGTSVRVGDEVEVELQHARLPNATSALAVVDGRLVEVENAANAIGQIVKIKIVDIDDEGTMLAEPRSLPAPAAGEAKKRRRRGGRGRAKPLTAAEQTEELRELAEEAAKGSEGRVALGISTASEAEAEEVETRQHTALAPPIASIGNPAGVAGPATGDEPPAPGLAYASYGGEGEGRRRRRRRRRPRVEGEVAANGVPQLASVTPIGIAAEGTTAPQPAAADGLAPAPLPGEENGIRRRRRRRRRRGRGGAGAEGAAVAGVTPDRHIFRVGSDGATEASGETAPPEPGRAIARLDERSAPIALEAPPPSITLPDEEPPKLAKPARRRRTAAAAAEATPAELVTEHEPALPPAQSPAAEAPKRRGRPRKVAAGDQLALGEAAAPVAPPEPEKPKRGRKPKAASEAVAEADEPKKPAAKTRKTAAKKSAAPARKKTTRKKTSA